MKMCPGVVRTAVRIPADSRSEQRSAVVSSQSPVRLKSVTRGKRTVSTISGFPRDCVMGESGSCTYAMPYVPSASMIRMAWNTLAESWPWGIGAAAASVRAAKPLTVSSLGVMNEEILRVSSQVSAVLRWMVMFVVRETACSASGP